eukprot:Colp12_sorted_trinity150504_noHs@30709
MLDLILQTCLMGAAAYTFLVKSYLILALLGIRTIVLEAMWIPSLFVSDLVFYGFIFVLVFIWSVPSFRLTLRVLSGSLAMILTWLNLILSTIVLGSFMILGTMIEWEMLPFLLKRSGEVKAYIAEATLVAVVASVLLWLTFGSAFVFLRWRQMRLKAGLKNSCMPFIRAYCRDLLLAASILIVYVFIGDAIHRANSQWKDLRGNYIAQAAAGFIESSQVNQYASTVSLNIELLNRPQGDTANLDFIQRTKNSQIKNIIMIRLESTRADAIDKHSAFSKRVLVPEFLESNEEISPFLRNLYYESAHAPYFRTNVAYTLKSSISINCGIYPVPNGYLVEHILTPYAECLPKLLGRYNFSSAFFDPTIGTFDHGRESVELTGFDKVFFGQEDWVNPPSDIPKSYTGYYEDAIIPVVTEWIDQQTAIDKPFFLNFHTSSPHHPHHIPSNWNTRKLSETERANRYMNTLMVQDKNLRALWKEFEARGLMENTLFIFSESTAEGVYEGNFRVPMFIYSRAPIVKELMPPGPYMGNWSNIDVVPTILDLLREKSFDPTTPSNYGSSYGYEGSSMLLPWDKNRSTFSISNPYNRAGFALLKDNMKYVWQYRQDKHLLFNLTEDPQEQNPLDLEQLTADQLLWFEEAKVRTQAINEEATFKWTQGKYIMEEVITMVEKAYKEALSFKW